jgi:hypothetical protein
VEAAADLDMDAEIASASGEVAEFGEGVATRKKSNRRRRVAVSSASSEMGTVADFALETPKAT